MHFTNAFFETVLMVTNYLFKICSVEEFIVYQRGLSHAISINYFFLKANFIQCLSYQQIFQKRFIYINVYFTLIPFCSVIICFSTKMIV